MSAESLSFLTKARTTLRGKVTRMYNDRENFVNYSDLERNTAKIKLEKLSSDLSIANDKIADLKFSVKAEDSVIQDEIDSCDEYGDKICDLLSRLEVASRPIRPNQVATNESARSLLKSPIAPLPVFSSKPGENFNLFIGQFEETVSKFSYTEYDKLLLLKQQITGRASYLLDSLEADKQTYNEAKKLLSGALASIPVQKFNVIQQMSEIKLEIGDEPFKYISNMRNIMEATDKLDLSVKDVQQYFFFNGLNETFKEQLIALTKNNRPTVDEIVAKFFEATERYDAIMLSKPVKSGKSDSSTTALLVTNNSCPVKNPFKECSLCPGATPHPINKCVKYPNPLDKIARLKSLGACLKCGNSDHDSFKCKFRFKKSCNMCSKWHFSFLCPSYSDFKKKDSTEIRSSPSHEKKTESKESTPKQANSSKSMVAGLCNSNNNIDSILSTLTVRFSNSDKPVRALMDFGSQSSFIEEKLLTNKVYTVLDDDVRVEVKGINESKTYSSKLIQMDLQFGELTLPVKLLTLPSIDINLDLPNLSNIIFEFKRKNYHLADTLLDMNTKSISNIGMLLGANASQVFEGEYVRFGNSSTYLNTKFGVLLVGAIEDLSNDVPSLPFNSNTTVSFAANVVFNKPHAADSATPPQTNKEYAISAATSNRDISKCGVDDLEDSCSFILNKENSGLIEGDLDQSHIEYLLENTDRTADGRLIISLLWNNKVKHLLSTNYQLALGMLNSCLRKFSKNADKLLLIEENFRELEKLGIIEEVKDFENFKRENPEYSFLPHMTILKPQKETTKVRTVFLSNLCEKKTGKLSHNQCMYSGPCVNQKLTTALVLLRFDPKLLVFDLKKAFLQIELPEEDKNKLLFMWVKSVENGDFDVKIYRNNRLPFGLRPSPTILMLGLYKILMLDSSEDSPELMKLKHLIYSLIYMDNGAITGSTSEELCSGFHDLPKIFDPYKFELQQYATNDSDLKQILGQEEDIVNLFGLKWNTAEDTISIQKVPLDEKANTKRKVLMSIASVYDPHNYEGPILNRARLFLHALQSDKKLGWDKPLESSLQNEWNNIVKQFNSSPPISIPRFIGSRDGKYRLIAYTDASTVMYGCVIYIECIETSDRNFLCAKNRIVNKALEGKSVPSLELNAINLGTETLHDMRHELSGPQCVFPIDITEMHLFSDSLVCLGWLNSFVIQLDKMNKVNTFVKNRLEKISKACESFPIRFSFVDGINNPADLISRPISSKLLIRSNYFTGPSFVESTSRPDILNVTIPHPSYRSTSVTSEVHTTTTVMNECAAEHLVPLERFSSLKKTLNVYIHVMKFVNNVKLRLKAKYPEKEPSKLFDASSQTAMKFVLKIEQEKAFKEVFTYFANPPKSRKNIPNLILQLNLFVDKCGLLRVGSKMMKRKKSYFPLLLPKESLLTELLIRGIHERRAHIGIYSVLSELRKQYWLLCCFSVAKRIIRKCVHCRRYNNRPIKLNQGMYRDFRLSPSQIPFANVFLDYAGPYSVRIGGSTSKVYILVITCLFTRAINLRVSLDLTNQEFLRSLQWHSFEHGVPLKVVSDLGTQLVSGSEIVTQFLSDDDTMGYLSDNGSKTLSFEQFYKGHKQLGSLVECCVKLSKRLISGAIRNSVLPLREFEFFVAQTKHLVNRRPIAYRESLRDTFSNELPEPITPELLLNGHNLKSANLIPSLQSVEESDPDFSPNLDPLHKVREIECKLRKIRSRLFDLYNKEFIPQLVTQATNTEGRYKPVTHNRLKVGDIVLLNEENTKRTNLPMGRIIEIQVNNLDEVTGALVQKGNSGEKVKRHSSVLIPLLTDLDWRPEGENEETTDPGVVPAPSDVGKSANGAEDRQSKAGKAKRPKRKAAVASEKTTRSMLF